ncbi:MAG: TolC family protein [Nannocystis sp.]|nr:TolC family protein [Nannocystis sp.]
MLPLLLAAALLVAPSPSPAAPATDPHFGAIEVTIEVSASERAGALTLTELLEAVDRHHPLLTVSRLDITVAEAQELAARGWFDTGLSARGALMPLGYYINGRMDVAAQQRTPLWGTRFTAGYRLGRGVYPEYYGQYRTLSAGEIRAGVEVPILRGGRIDPGRAGIRKAQLGREVAAAAFERERIALHRDATYAYWDWVAAGQGYLIAEEQLGLARTRADQLLRRVERGDLPAIDALDNQRAVLQRDAELIRARRRLEQSALKLSLFLRADDGRPLVLDPARLPAAMAAPHGEGAPDPHSQIEAAFNHRPELRELDRQRRQIEVDLQLARNDRMPAVDVGMMVLRDLGRGDLTLGPTELQATVFIDVPIQARAARGRRQAAEAKIAAIDAKAAFARDKITAEVRDAISALLAAHERIDTAREGLEVAKELADAERRRFELGASSLLFVNLREQQVAEAAQSQVAALLDYYRATADLTAATASASAALRGP